jgi:hypothetical protein
MDQYQFYPSYARLAERAWAKFRSTTYVRVLEPSAGDGDLACKMPFYQDPGERTSVKGISIDCCEIDMSRHDRLRARGLTVVGVDFMSLGNGSIYSHCIMNPPFAQGAKHVLKAWDILWDAEIVAILNAETIRNPYTKERQMLVQLIEQHGEVEFIGRAFLDSDAERAADVEVALVYLKKSNPDVEHIIGDLFSGLRKDTETGAGMAGDYQDFQQVAMAKSTIENMVLTFDAAVLAVTESVRAQSRADYYTNLIGNTFEMRNTDAGATAKRLDTTVTFVQRRMYAEYEALKNRAWAGLLHSSNVKSRLSSKAQKRVESQFENIKKLEFTLSNIYGFLGGILASQGTIQTEMACDVFDQIVAYHSENSVYYKGWKSNDRHRECGMRIKGTRFVLPRHGTEPHEKTIGSTSLNLLTDFDKVFAMLDGKAAAEVGLVDAFENHFKELQGGARISCSYFDVRYYPKIGTIHFFPKNAALMDRLNRMVGRQRAWLPPEASRVSDDFWLQFEKADTFDAELRAEVKKIENLSPGARDSLWFLSSTDADTREKASRTIDAALTVVLQKHGISTEYQLEAAQQSLLLTA